MGWQWSLPAGLVPCGSEAQPAPWVNALPRHVTVPASPNQATLYVKEETALPTGYLAHLECGLCGEEVNPDRLWLIQPHR